MQWPISQQSRSDLSSIQCSLTVTGLSAGEAGHPSTPFLLFQHGCECKKNSLSWPEAILLSCCPFMTGSHSVLLSHHGRKPLCLVVLSWQEAILSCCSFIAGSHSVLLSFHGRKLFCLVVLSWQEVILSCCPFMAGSHSVLLSFHGRKLFCLVVLS